MPKMTEVGKLKRVLKRYGLEVDSFGGIDFICKERGNGRIAHLNVAQKIAFTTNMDTFEQKPDNPKKTLRLGNALRILKWQIHEDEKVFGIGGRQRA